MRAAYVEELGPAEEIRIGELPRPEPGPADVLVRVEAVAVNPVDTYVRSGAYRTALTLPFIIGRDLVGIVEDAGAGAVGFAPGDHVWCNSLGHGGRQGPAAQYAVVAAERLYHLPDGADPVKSVAVVHPVATAQLALFTHGRLEPGETVYVAGGAGHVGGAAITLAVRAGARVIASAGPEDLDRCRALGAEVALDYHDPELTARVADAAPGGVELQVDTSGHNDLVAAVGLLARRGRIVVIAGLRATTEIPLGELYRRDGRVIGFVISNASVAELAGAAERINQLLAAGILDPGPVETLPLSAAAEAHRRLESGAARGRRLVLAVSRP